MGIQKKNMVRYGISAALLVSILFAVRREYSLLGVSDAFAISGLMFMILALFRTAKYMRFYDLPIYGFKKFVEIWKVKEPSRKIAANSAGSHAFFKMRAGFLLQAAESSDFCPNRAAYGSRRWPSFHI